MTSTEIHLHTVGGRHRFVVRDAESSRAPVVVVAPALGVRASYYDKLCKALAAQGIAAAAIDLPGHGDSPARASRTCDWGYAELVEHYGAACEAIAAARPGADQFVLGHSIGGQVALMLAGRDVRGLRGVVLVASGAPYWRAWRGAGALRVRLGTAACAAIARTLGYFPGDRVGFGGREAQTLIRQWAAVARTGRYDLDGLDGEALLAAAGPPTLAIGLDGDTLAPESAIRVSLDRLVAREVRFERWHDPPHGGDHNRWPSAPTHIVDRVVAFVHETLAHSPTRRSPPE